MNKMQFMKEKNTTRVSCQQWYSECVAQTDGQSGSQRWDRLSDVRPPRLGVSKRGTTGLLASQGAGAKACSLSGGSSQSTGGWCWQETNVTVKYSLCCSIAVLYCINTFPYCRLLRYKDLTCSLIHESFCMHFSFDTSTTWSHMLKPRF